MEKVDVAIIGGGLAGLTAASILAKEGKHVIVLEKSNRLGGRAITNHNQGALFNVGAHALYTGGEAWEIFKDLGIDIVGKSALVQSHGIFQNKVHPFTTGIGSLLKTPLLTLSEKMQFIQLVIQIWKMNIENVPEISLSDWVETRISSPMVKQHFYALCRTSTYTDAPDLQLARTVLRQLQRALKSKVMYVDGGWESMVASLREKAENLAVETICHSRVVKIEDDNHIKVIRCPDDKIYQATDVIISTPPDETLRLIDGMVGEWPMNVIPVTATCLDLYLKRLPNPVHQFVLGIDQPIFFTNESRAATVCEDGHFVVHLVKYHNPIQQGQDQQQNKEQLEKMMDLIQPGWRKEVISQQFLPKMTVTYDFPRIGWKPFGPEIPGTNGLYVAGDWAGNEELLSDAAVASGKRAAIKILAKSKVLA